jgi:hypothetical protein
MGGRTAAAGGVEGPERGTAGEVERGVEAGIGVLGGYGVLKGSAIVLGCEV